MKQTYYFSHDYHARNDDKVLMLRAKHGMEGYGIYWALVEMMYENSRPEINHQKLEGTAMAIGVTVEKLKMVVDTCLEEKLFKANGDSFWSEAVKSRREKLEGIRKVRAEVGHLGGIKSKGKAIGKQLPSKTEAKISKGKESKGKDIKGNTNTKKNNTFIKPSFAEITSYCQERNNQVDPATFRDYYESNGWMVGRNKMKDWKATVRYWERNQRKPVGKGVYSRIDALTIQEAMDALVQYGDEKNIRHFLARLNSEAAVNELERQFVKYYSQDPKAGDVFRAAREAYNRGSNAR